MKPIPRPWRRQRRWGDNNLERDPGLAGRGMANANPRGGWAEYFRYLQRSEGVEDVVLEPMTAMAAVKTTDEALGVVARLVSKLRARPDVAALKLSMALDEIVKTYTVVDSTFATYASLAIDPDALTQRSQELLSIAGGALRVQVDQGRGNCHNIYVIYDTYLKKWFSRVLNPQEQREIERVFLGPNALADADNTLFQQLGELADELSADAKLVLNMVYEGKHSEARERVWSTYQALEPVQSAITKSTRTLIKLKDEFGQLARASRPVAPLP